MTERTRGVIATEIPADALAVVIADHARIEPHEVRAEQTFLLDRGESKSPRYAIVNTQGVGQAEPEGGKPFEVYTECLSGLYAAPVDKLAEAAKGGEEHDLADVVSVFGARLESNFRLWKEWATS